MRAIQRFRLNRLARDLTRERGWIDADPPTWEWPPLWGPRYRRGAAKNALFAIHYGTTINPTK